MPKLIVMVGESGSGKSTRSKGMVRTALAAGKKVARVNRDNYRSMLFDGVWTPKLEGLVKKAEVAAVKVGLDAGYDMIVDDTNLHPGTQEMWKQLARETEIPLEVHVMDTPFEECVRRDEDRMGKEHVGRAVIERQFLQSGRATFPKDKKIVLVDVDGTLADCTDIRSPFDESKVHLDKPHKVVCQWVRNLVHWTGYCVECFKSIPYTASDGFVPGDCVCTEPTAAPEYSVVIVSGRHDTCGDSTVRWLMSNGITFDHIFMRRGGDNRPDTIIKQEILDAILKYVEKEQIAFVIDDRPKVIQMWKDNGLTVYPARGAVEPF
jgi:predicted kinase